MTLILRPKGPGNWRPITIQVTDQRASPLLVKVGDPVKLGGIEFKVSRVLP